MGRRRNIELFLLVMGAVPVLALYALYVMGQGGTPSLETLIVPIGLVVAFAAAHVAIRFLAPGADPAILPIVLTLSGIGITFVTRLAPALAVRQVVWLFVSIAAMVAVLAAVRNLENLARYKYTLCTIGLVLLVIPMIVGTEHYGSKLWVEIGSFSFQPGEIAKVLVIIFLASFLSENRELLSAANLRIAGLRIPRLRMLLPLLVMWLISLAIVVWERDLGSAVLFFAIFVVMLYVATGRWFYPIFACVLLVAGAVLAYQCFGHVRVRFEMWLDPFADPQGNGYQIIQALYSLADGGLLGTGIGQGMPTLIPLVASDFIFAAIGEEMGLLGASAIALLFMLFAVRGLLTAARARSDLAAFMAAGLTAAVCLQAFLIMGGVTKLIPMTGVTLPFMSQGGSSLLASFAIVALLLRCGDEGTGQQAEVAGLGIAQGGAEGTSRTGIRKALALETPESGVLGRRALSKRLTALTVFFAIVCATLIAWLAYVQLIYASELRESPQNNHVIAQRAYMHRGSIITSDGVVLAASTKNEDGTYTRVYPQGTMAAHAVGYVSTQYGSTGIERLYDDELSGQSAVETWDDLLEALTDPYKPGNDVVLTINARIQAAAEEALAGRVGAIVVLDPATCAVLAEASSPTYSFEQLPQILSGEQDQSAPLYNRATQALYAPGSTFKVITLAAALDAGIATLDTPYESPAALEIGGGEVSNYEYESYGTIDLRTAFALSSNTVFAQVATQLGAMALTNVAHSFGYGMSYGQGFANATSLMPLPQEMTEWELAWAGVGQPVGQHKSAIGPQTTVMQNALVAATIANGGTLVRPFLVRGVTDSTGAFISTTTPQRLGTACTPATAAAVAQAMLTTVEQGTGTAAAIAGVDVAGKTGTAETGSGDPDAWFIGYAPYEAPVAAIAVVIEDDAEHTATTVAGDVLQIAVEALLGDQTGTSGTTSE